MGRLSKIGTFLCLGAVSACGGGGGGDTDPVTEPVREQPAQVTLLANPSSIDFGHTTVISWSSTRADGCMASGGWSGAQATNGTYTPASLTSTTTYKLTCTGDGGSGEDSVVVTVGPGPAPAVPSVTLWSEPASIDAGETTLIRWSSTEVDSCVASGGWSGEQATSGAFRTVPLTATTTYTLECTGTEGNADASVVVTVAASQTPDPPTVSLSANPTTVEPGQTALLTWSSEDATSCIASGGWSGTVATSGSFTTPPLAEATTYSLSCAGAGGSTSVSVVVSVSSEPTPNPPSVTISADPASILSGQTSRLTWSTTDATSCTASDGWSGAKPTSGTFRTPALTTTTTYALSCTGDGGSADASVVVTVNPNPPTVTLSASPDTVATGETTLLTWSSTDATSCTRTGGFGFPATPPAADATSGSRTTNALTATNSFKVTCTGPGGTGDASVTVTVVPTPTVSLSAAPPGVPLNGSTTLTWSSNNATTCTASGGWSGAKALSGSQVVGPLSADTTYRLKCSGTGGDATAITTVSVRIARLSWEAPTQNSDGSPLTDLAGYRVYWGTSSRSYSGNATVTGAGTTSYTVQNLAAGTWYFTVTARNENGVESAYSSEESKTIN